MLTASRDNCRTWPVRIGVVGMLLSAVNGCSLPHRTALDLVVEPDQLAKELSRKNRRALIVLDVRKADDYANEHVAGALHLDAAAWVGLSLDGPTDMDHKAAWYERIGSLGIDGNHPVAIYDDGRMTEAARVWFILQHFGVAEPGVVNGGYPALQPLIVERRIEISRDPVLPKETRFIRRQGPETGVLLADRKQVKNEVIAGSARVLDARTQAEFSGEDRRSNARAGHLPGAINLPHQELLDERGRLKSPEELAVVFEQAGLIHGEPVVTYCQGGGRASLAALAALHAGYGPVWNYYRSFGDWASDSTCPLESPVGE